MKCPHCGREIPGIPCGSCGASNPKNAKYCMECGSPVVEQVEPVEEAGGFDLEDRLLCPDGRCTGIIVNGRCTECGKRVDEHGLAEED